MGEKKEGSVEAIMAGFEQMLEHDTFEHISVSALCKTVGVSRKTFYTHFRDKRAVLRRIVERDIADPVTTLMPYFTLANWQDGGKLLVRQIYEALYRHREFYLRAAMVNHIDVLGDVMRETLTETTLAIFRGEGGEYSEKYRYAALFTAGAQVATMEEWFRDGMRIPPEQLVEWVFEFSGSGNAALLDTKM